MCQTATVMWHYGNAGGRGKRARGGTVMVQIKSDGERERHGGTK